MFCLIVFKFWRKRRKFFLFWLFLLRFKLVFYGGYIVVDIVVFL